MTMFLVIKFNLNIGCIWIWEVQDLKKAGLKFNLNIGCIWIQLTGAKQILSETFNLNIGCIWMSYQLHQVGNWYDV